MKLKIVGITGVATAALLMTSLPALGADGTHRTLEGRLSAGSQRSAGAWINLDEAHIAGDPGDDGAGKEYWSEDAEYTLTLQAKRQRGARRACSAVAWVSQWNRSEREWVVILERPLINRSTSPRKAASTTWSDDFRLDGQPTYLGINTNRNCAGTQAWLSSSLPWHDADA